mmetsp:Transcript_12879/g.19956  ORF Transcript_12879/g.19956 Transcript_12879/m.19956 type:complete len:707 (+) Transcript_12879:274-2394(+)
MSTMPRQRKKGNSKTKKVSSKEQPGLRVLTQKRYLNDIFQFCADNHDGWMVLIVDKKATKALSSAVGMYDIMERRVTLVEDIERKRAPFTDQGAIYLLAPTEDSVNRLISDWEGNILYGKSVFIFFLGRLSEKYIEKIKACRPLVQRIKCLMEANVDFLAKESRAFHFDMRKAFQDVYLRKSRTKAELRMADKLISVCSTLNEYPHIRFANESPSATTLARQLDIKLNQFLKNPEFWFHGDANNPDRERATLLILDRKDDCLTPLMHDFFYQAMVNDVLNVNNDKITLAKKSGENLDDYEDDDSDSDYDDEDDDDDNDGRKQSKSPKKKVEKPVDAVDILLNEDDAVWVELRGKHIAEVINTLSERVQEMINSDTSGLATKSKGKSMTLSQMADALKALPEYQEVMSKLSQHMQIAHQCMEKLRSNNLMELSEIEQTLATGEKENGSTPSIADLMELVINQLKSMSDPKARFRLLLLTIMSQNGVKEEYQAPLFTAAQITNEQEKVLEALVDTMDIPLINKGNEGKSRFQKLFGNTTKKNIDINSQYANSRYVPPLKYILDELIHGKLSIKDYPAVRDLPESHGSGSGTATSARPRPTGSARQKKGATARWARSKNSKDGSADETYQGGRVIVFIIGGMSWPELRVIRELMQKESKEVIAGSTYFTTPLTFLDDIQRLAKKPKSHSPKPHKKSSKKSSKRYPLSNE